MLDIIAEKNIQPGQVIFMGNDVNDIPAFEACGLRRCACRCPAGDLAHGRPGSDSKWWSWSYP